MQPKSSFALWVAAVMLCLACVGSVCNTTAAAESPEVETEKMMHALGSGDTAAAWDALPEKYQAEIKDVVGAFAKNLDADVWNAGFKALAKLTQVLKTKKEFVIGSDLVTSLGERDKKYLVDDWDKYLVTIETLADSEIKTLDGLKQLDVGAFCRGPAKKAVGSLFSVSFPGVAVQTDQLRSAKVTFVSVDGDTAMVKTEWKDRPGVDGKVIRVGGKWLPSEMVEAWDGSMTGMTNFAGTLKLEPTTKAHVLQFIGMIDGALDRLAAAKDQAAFDAELKNAVAQFSTIGAGPQGAPKP